MRKIEKITREQLEYLINGVDYHTRNTTTICFLDLNNGFTVVGKSSCMNPKDFDAVMGRKIAHEDAIKQMWALEGFARMTTALLLGDYCLAHKSPNIGAE